MTIWLSADFHLRHRRILELDNRPFSTLEEHDAEIVRRWNERVKPGDTCYILGDFCFSGVARCIDFKNQLNGNIILIKGNHDGSMTRMKKVFTEVYNSLVIDINGRKVRLSHRPHRDLASYQHQNSIGMAPPDDGMWLIHGHTHKGGRKVHDRQINVNLIFWDYRPVSESEISGIIDMEENLPRWKRMIRGLYGKIKRLFTVRRVPKKLPQKGDAHL